MNLNHKRVNLITNSYKDIDVARENIGAWVDDDGLGMVVFTPPVWKMERASGALASSFSKFQPQTDFTIFIQGNVPMIRLENSRIFCKNYWTRQFPRRKPGLD